MIYAKDRVDKTGMYGGTDRGLLPATTKLTLFLQDFYSLCVFRNTTQPNMDGNISERRLYGNGLEDRTRGDG